jgi:hypothetical protein
MPDSPFSVLSFIGAPAVLTNATSVLLLSTANRLGRTVTRARDLVEQIGAAEPRDTPFAGELRWELDIAERRVLVAVRAMMALYMAVGSFAAGTLAAFIGVFAGGFATRSTVFVTIGVGVIGFIALITAAALLVYEAHLAFRLLHHEASRIRAGSWRGAQE